MRKSVLVGHTHGDEKKCAHTPRLHKEPIFGRAIKMQSRTPAEQCFTFWSLHMGVIEIGKNCARTPSLERTNRAINMHSRGPAEQ